jgi:hypothetical protein
MDVRKQHIREMQLESLLRALLGEDTRDGVGAPAEGVLLPEVVALRDTARRLRAAVQCVPLPSGRTAVRKALITTVKRARRVSLSGTASRRAHGWRVTAGVAAAVIMGVWGIGAGLSWGGLPPSSPWYGARVALEELEMALTPGRLERAEMLLRATRLRVAEVQAMAEVGDPSGLRRAADALDGEAGWLHAIMTTLSAADRDRLRLGLKQI